MLTEPSIIRIKQAFVEVIIITIGYKASSEYFIVDPEAAVFHQTSPNAYSKAVVFVWFSADRNRELIWIEDALGFEERKGLTIEVLPNFLELRRHSKKVRINITNIEGWTRKLVWHERAKDFHCLWLLSTTFRLDKPLVFYFFDYFFRLYLDGIVPCPTASISILSLLSVWRWAGLIRYCFRLSAFLFSWFWISNNLLAWRLKLCVWFLN